MTRATSGLVIEKGREVAANGRRFFITHVLDLDAVVARDPETGLSERLLISDLQALDSEADATPTPELSQVNEKDWDEARRRLALIKPFLEQSRTVRSEVEQAASAFGVEASTVYRWLRYYRATETLSSLLPTRSDGGRGKPRVSAEIEAIITLAIDNYHLTKQQPSVRATANEVARLCRAAGVRSPHPNTVRARINARSERERIRRRAHKKDASDRFEARPGEFDAATRPLSLIQID